MTTCKLYLVRHGESVDNRDDIVGGHHDSPLTDLGQIQALQTKELLKNVYFDAVYSSDLSRASETGAIIYGRDVPKDHQLAELRERTFGRLEGKKAEQEWFRLNREYEAKYSHLPFEERWHYNYADFIEGDKSLYDRVSKALLKIAQQHQGQTVLVANHGGGIRILLMKLGYARLLTAGSFKNAGYVELTSDGKIFHIEKVVGVNTDGTNAE